MREFLNDWRDYGYGEQLRRIACTALVFGAVIVAWIVVPNLGVH